jgi:VanZ family protein
VHKRPLTLARIILAILTAAIIYVSFYPFHFHGGAGFSEDLAAFLATCREGTSRSDILANILLYLPFGFFAAHAMADRTWLPRIIAATAAGIALSAGIELAQFYDWSRDSRMADLYCNAAGTLAGAVAARFIPLVPVRTGALPRERLFPGGLLVCWLASRLYPFVPAGDIYKYWLAVKPLVRQPRLELFDLYRHTAIWLAVALMLEDAAGDALAGWAFLVFVPAVLAARVAVVENVLSPAEVCGAAIALAAWMGMRRRPLPAEWLAVLLAGAVVVHGLAPFRFGAAHPFGWVPYRSFLLGSSATGVRSFAEKSFLYGGLLWLMRKAGASWAAAAAAGGMLVFAVHYAQRWIPGRSAEITDTILLLTLAGIMKLLADGPGQRISKPAMTSSQAKNPPP